MSSASAGQLDSFLSFKTTPEVELDSLQLNKEQVSSGRSVSPEMKTESPMMDVLFDSKITLDSLNEKLNLTHDEHVTTNPDETINHETTQIIKEPMTKLEQVNESASKINNDVNNQPPEKTLLVPESHQNGNEPDHEDNSKVSAYARLEFENFIFYVQTLQVVLGRKSENDQSHSVDVHLGDSKAISRKHAKIFYNFGTERFELSIQGKNGAFADDVFIERGATVPLTNKSKVQIGQIVFRFVLPGMNPQEKLESPSKPINPADAISLRSSLYHHTSADGSHDKSGSNTPGLSSKDFEPVSTSAGSKDDDAKENIQSAGAGATATSGEQKKTKEKKAPRPPKPPKKVYTLEEIPEEFRTKPACSYSNLIATCLRTHGTPKGMSLAEIYKSIKELFPYYKYCPDGWQSSVRHNLSLNKAFRKVSKEGKGWLWGLDEEYCAEKERLKKKQAAAAAAKAKAAALKLEQQQIQQQKLQQQRLEQQRLQQNVPNTQQQQHPQFQQKPIHIPTQTSQPNLITQNIPLQSSVNNQPQQQQQQQKLSQITLQNTKPPLQPTQSQYRQSPQPLQPQSAPAPIQQSQEQHISSQLLQPSSAPPTQPKFTPQPQLQQQTQLQQSLPQYQQPNNSVGANKSQQFTQPQHSLMAPQRAINRQTPQPSPFPYQPKTPSIQAQLAANRGIGPQLSRPPSQQPIPKPAPTGLTADTKKALAHLQQQLVILSKDLKTLVDRPTISAILTQAIAMTIAQVTQAAKTKGITSDPLATLIETNPQQLTRILTVALNAATFKVTNGRIKAPLSIAPSVNNSAPSSRGGTPGLAQHSPSPPTNQQQHQASHPPQPPLQAKPQSQRQQQSQPPSHVSSPVVSKIPIQPIQQNTSQPQNTNLNQGPQPQSQNNFPQPVAQLQPVKSQSTPLLSNPPNNTSQTQPSTPNPPKVQPVQRANSTAAPAQMGVHQFGNNSLTPMVPPQHSSTPFTQSSQQSPPVQLQRSPVHNSITTNIQGQTLRQHQTEPSTPQLQKTQPLVSETIEANRPASQPNANANSGLNFNLGTSHSEVLDQLHSGISSSGNQGPNPSIQSLQHAPQQIKSEHDPVLQTVSLSEIPQTAPQSQDSSVSTSSIHPIQSHQPTSGPNETEKPVVVKQEPMSNDNSNHEAPDLSFLGGDLNDEEFDKVLKSLSKESTPAVEGEEEKTMDPDELNRLLSSNFTQTYESGPSNSKKRQLDDDANVSASDAHNDKVAKN